jgi:hypothetical protein
MTVLLLTALALTACSRAARPEAAPGPAAPAIVASASTSPPAPSGSGVGSGSPAATGTPDPRPSAPASYVDFYRNGLGTLVPAGWTKNQQAADHTDLRDGSGELLLRLGTTYSGAGPVAYLRQLADRAAETYPQYQQIQLGGMNHGQSQYPYSTWEFTFVKDGATRHVIEAAFALSDGDPATFAQVYFSAPTRYFDQTLTAWGHAVNGVYAAG